MIGRASVVAALLAAAAGFHLAALPSHADSGPYAAFFGATAVLQLAGAVLLVLRPARWVRVAIVAGSVAVLGVWVVARTSGVPFGPEAGIRHGVGVLDGLAAAVEVAVVAGLVAARSRRWTRSFSGIRLSGAIGVLGVVCAVSALGGTLTDQPSRHPAVRHSHSAPHAEPVAHAHGN